MKTASILTAILVGISSAAMAQNEGGRRPGGSGERGGQRGPGGPGRMMPVLAALDANKDREISGTEIAEAAAALKKLDKNRDGKLTIDELRPRVAPGGPGGPGAREPRREDGGGEGRPGERGQGRPGGEGQRGRRGDGPGRAGGPGDGKRPMMPLLAALDADRNGEISAAEISNAPSALKTLDRNSDGRITAEEIRPQFGPGGPGRRPRKDGRGGRPGGPEARLERPGR